MTCLCPTYGRFELLRESLACFLAQDYPNKRLLILNDAPRDAIVLDATGTGNVLADMHIEAAGVQARRDGVLLINGHTPFDNLGLKRQALLELAPTPLVAHWDDDDLYLPWHLSDCVEWLRYGCGCRKLRRTFEWGADGGPRTRELWRWKNAGNDGSMLFDRQTALTLGGYPQKQVGQSIGLLRKFTAAGRYAPLDQEIPSVVVRRFPGHNFGVKSAEAFREANSNFGDGQPLTPADLAPIWEKVIEGTRTLLPPDKHAELERRLRCER